MPAKVAINVGDSVMWLYQGSTNHYKVIRKYAKTAWIQKNYKSKYLKNENPVIRHVPLKHLRNINKRLTYMDSFLKKKIQNESMEEREERLKRKRLQNKNKRHCERVMTYIDKLKKQQPEVYKEWRKKRNFNRKPGNWRILLKIKHT